jgi:cyclic pyranopterin phosphate synthase
MAAATRRARPSALSHVDSKGQARMVDVGGKPVTAREAVASGSIRITAAAMRQIRRGGTRKGDPLQAARLAGVMAAKQTAALIPLCHPLPLTDVQVDLVPHARGYTIEEALTAVAVAALTIYDMVKAADKSMVIGDIRLEYKSGGRSGTYRRRRR